MYKEGAIMRHLLQNGVIADMRAFADGFSKNPRSVCAFISYNGKQLEKQADSFATAVTRKASSTLVTVDMAIAVKSGRNATQAIYCALLETVRKNKSKDPILHSVSNTLHGIVELCNYLITPGENGEISNPILYLKHFQWYLLVAGSNTTNEYIFLSNELPARIIITSNMDLIEIENQLFAYPMLSQPLLSSKVVNITIENDVQIDESLLKNSISFDIRRFVKAFTLDPEGKCAFVARDEKKMEELSEKFATSIARMTNSHLVFVDMASAVKKGKKPTEAILNALQVIAEKNNIAHSDKYSIIESIKDLCRLLTIKDTSGRVIPPVILFTHFQCYTLTVGASNIAEYAFLREIPCRLVISSNMELGEIEQSIDGMRVSYLSLMTKTITIKGDQPYRSSEAQEACFTTNSDFE